MTSPPKDVAERGALAQHLEIQLSPIWSQHIKKDFLGVFPLRRTGRLGGWVDLKTAPIGFSLLTDRTSYSRKARVRAQGVKRNGHDSPHGSFKPTLALQSGSRGRSAPITDQNALSSARAPQLKRSLIWPWYQIIASHPPNRAILSTWTESSRAEPKDSFRFASRKIFDTSVERARLEDDSIPSKKSSAYSKKEIHQDRLSARVLSVVKKSFYDYGFSISEVPSGLIVPVLLSPQRGQPESAAVARSAAVRSGNEGDRTGGRHWPIQNRLLLDSAHGMARRALLPEGEHRPPARSLVRKTIGPVGPCSPKVTAPAAGTKPSKKFYKPRLPGFTKSGRVALLKAKITMPKKSFWEYAHFISGYNFPELQDSQVADLYAGTDRRASRDGGRFRFVPKALNKVVASSQSKIEWIARLSEPNRQRAQSRKLDPIGHLVTKSSRVDPNQVLLTPYLVKVPPKVLVTASHQTEGLTRSTGVNKRWTTNISNTILGLLLAQPESRECRIEVKEADSRPPSREARRSRGRSVEKDFEIWYTPLELDQQNKVKKAFKEIGRDYSEYLKKPKDSLPALLLSPSLEEDKQIEEEEVQRLAQEKAAAKAAAKRTKDEEEDRISDSQPNEEDFNTRDPFEVSFREGKGDLSNIEQEPLNDEETEDSRFERLRFTREIEAKNEEQASQGLALSLTCRDSTKRLVGRARQSFRGLSFVRARGNINDNFAGTEFRFVPEALRTLRLSDRKHSFFGQRSFWPTRLFSQEERLVSTHTVTPYIRYDQNNPWLLSTLQAAPVAGTIAQSAHALAQSAHSPVELTCSTGSLARSASAHSSVGRVRVRVCAPNRGFDNSTRNVTRADEPNKADDLQNLRNLQTQARLGLVRFVHLPVVEAASITEKRRALLSQRNRGRDWSLVTEGPQNDGFSDLEPSANSKPPPYLGPSSPAAGAVVRRTSAGVLGSAEQRNRPPARTVPVTSVSQTVPPAGTLARSATATAPAAGEQNHSLFNRPTGTSDLLLAPADGAVRASTHPSKRITPPFDHLCSNSKATTQPKSENRIYKSDPRLRSTSLESSISTDWRHDRKGEASAFRITSKERPHLVLPQLSENEWQKSLEWQLKRHFLDEDTRLEPLVATQPYKTFKVKKIERSLPWLTLEKPSFSPFQWPYKTVRVGSLLGPGRRPSSGPCRPVSSGLCLGPYRANRNFVPTTSCSAFLTASFINKGEHALAALALRASEAAHQRRAPAAGAGQIEGLAQAGTIKRYTRIRAKHELGLALRAIGCIAPVRLDGTKQPSLQNRRVLQSGRLRSAIQSKRPYGPGPNDIIRLPGTFFKEGSLTLAPCRLVKYSKIPLVGSFGTYSKGRTTISNGSTQFFDVTNKIFSSQNDLNTELLFEPPSILSWLLIYRLFLALILKEVLKYIYRISLKDFFIRIINSDFGRTITSPEFRQSVQFEPFPEYYKPKIRLKDLIGIKNALLPLSEIIWFLRNNCRSRSGPHGVVLLGPEGVNTTAIAQAVAGEAKVPIIVQSLRALTLTHTHPQKRLEKVLLLARAQSPCVLFLDELDVIGQAREGVIRSTSDDGNSLISLDSSQLADGLSQLQSPDDQATSQAASAAGRRIDLMLRLLTVMDGLHHLNGVVIITTSKNTATLDPALLRPGRFDRLIHLTLPNHERRMELFKAKTKELGHTDQMPWEYLSLQTTNMGGADIVSAINYSVLRAIVNDTVHTVETLEYGLNCVKALKEKRDQTRYKTF